MLDLASDLLFFWGGGRILARPGLRLGLPGCALCWIAGSTVWLLCMWVTNEV